MKRIATLAVLALIAPAALADVARCRAELDKRIARVESTMRGGYTAAQGNRLKERRRVLTQLRAECPKNPQAWKNAPI